MPDVDNDVVHVATPQLTSCDWHAVIGVREEYPTFVVPSAKLTRPVAEEGTKAARVIGALTFCGEGWRMLSVVVEVARAKGPAAVELEAGPMAVALDAVTLNE